MNSSEEVGLNLENELIVHLIQAWIGLISPNIQAISLELVGSSVTLHFSIRESNEETDEDISDILTEFDILVPREVTTLRTESHLYRTNAPYQLSPGRIVYRAKDEGADIGPADGS